VNTSTPEDTPTTICLTAIDLDGDTLDVTGAFNGPLNGAITGIADGDTCFTYTPSPDFNGTDTVSVVVCDNNGDQAIVVVNVNCDPVNDAPIAVDDGAATDVDTPVTITVLANDSDPNGDPITVTNATAGNGTVVINGDGTITYTPASGFCGTDTILYTICDPGPLCDQAIVVVTVTCPPVNDPPIAENDSTGTDQGTPVVIDVLDNDSDGSVIINNDGTITYTPVAGFCGTDTISYSICDPEPLCDQAIVLVEVECIEPLMIPNGFSPNGDGIADTWVIQGLQNYPDASVLIFNRWGNQVYSADPYMNDWNGVSTNALTIGEVLPAGTYWYLVDLGVDGEEVRSGYIYLNK
jgi:gliding motility-associated-like protein